MSKTYILACFDSLVWTQGVRSDPLYLSVEHNINLRGTASTNQFLLTVKQSIQLISQPYGHYGISNQSLLDSIQIRQDLRRNKYASVAQFINFNERFIVPKVQSVTQSITFTQTYTQPGRLINQAFTLINVINYNLVRNRTITDQLTYLSTQQAIKLKYNYVQTNPITITPNPLVSFVSTNLVPTLTLTIKAPDFENIDELHFNKVQHNSRNGDLIIYKDPIWPVWEVFGLHFSYLSQKDIYNLIIFINSTLGQDVIYTDFESRSWLGLITNPVGEIVQPGRFNHRAHIAFEGNLISNQLVTNSINPHQTVFHE